MICHAIFLISGCRPRRWKDIVGVDVVDRMIRGLLTPTDKELPANQILHSFGHSRPMPIEAPTPAENLHEQAGRKRKNSAVESRFLF